MQASRKLAVWVGISSVLGFGVVDVGFASGPGGWGGTGPGGWGDTGQGGGDAPLDSLGAASEGERLPLESPAEDPRGERLRALRGLDDAALGSHLEATVDGMKGRYPGWELDGALGEVLRRGGESWVSVLEAQLEVAARHTAEGAHLSVPRDLGILTALRRLEGKPDPIELLVDLPEEGWSLTFPELPTLSVTARNVDERAVGFQIGGNYRSGRSTRWNVVAFDANGKRQPGVDPWLGMGGGLSTRQLLSAGNTWEIDLPMASYTAPAGPGRTFFEVHYHDEATIADDPDPRGWITSKSKRFEFEWKPLTVSVTAYQWECLQEDLAELAEAGSPYLLRSKYGEDDYEHLDPKSAPGRLLSQGTMSLPALFEALEYKTLSFEERAWVLCLLHGITGLHNPSYAFGSLGTFRVQGGREYTRERSPEAQQGLVDRWLALRGCVFIKLP